MNIKELANNFKGFVKRGNVLDMAIGIVVGVAFGAISKSLVDDVIMPVVGLAIGRVDFKEMFVTLRYGDPGGPYQTLAEAQTAGAVTVNYGSFINTVVNFVVIAFAMFLVVRAVQRFNERGEPEATPSSPDPRRCPYCRMEVAEAATRCPACTSELEAPEQAEEAEA